jgi:hypothetical protein
LDKDDMASFLITGGQQHQLIPLRAGNAIAEYRHHSAILIRLDTTTRQSQLLMKYVSPEDASPRKGSMLYKAATLAGNRLYLCTTTEVFVFGLPDFHQLHYFTYPFFNDVHHVAPTPWGTLAVANTGLDMVVELTTSGEITGFYNTCGENPWAHFSRDIDYRRLNTKPHRAHPNYIFFVDDEMWVTRFMYCDAVSVLNPERKIPIQVGGPHDGIVQGDLIYFTTVNGHVVVANKHTLKIEHTVNLNESHEHGSPLGWARGIFVDRERIWVGFSRLRPTKFRENVKWVKAHVKRHLPGIISGKTGRLPASARTLSTRIACYDLTSGKCLDQIVLEPHGLSVVFSILDLQQIEQPETAAVENNCQIQFVSEPQ